MTAESLKAISRTRTGSGPLTRYCSGQPTGGPNSSAERRLTTPGNFSIKRGSRRLRSRSRASRAPSDDDRLGKEIVGKLHVQRHIKPDGSLSDIACPVVDIGVVLTALRRLQRSFRL